MNYGESLAYWYLRLNGFFPLKNFVLHSSHRTRDTYPSDRFNHIDPENNYIPAGDSDLIAVRFPFVYEEVGGQSSLFHHGLEGRVIEGIDKNDWDPRFSQWGISLSTDIIGLVVEVKARDLSESQAKDAINQSFNTDRLLMDIQRMGILPTDKAEEAAHVLTSHTLFTAQYSNGLPISIGKLLVSGTRRNYNLLVHDTPHITLSEISRFIKGRMNKYIGPKYRDRMFFSDELLQYLVWEAAQNA